LFLAIIAAGMLTQAAERPNVVFSCRLRGIIVISP
jgi:hypothetical protein